MTMYVARADHRTYYRVAAGNLVARVNRLCHTAATSELSADHADMGKENALSAGVFCSFGAFTTIDSSGQSALNCVFCGQKLRSTGASEPL
jgi:ribosomal protein S27AE